MLRKTAGDEPMLGQANNVALIGNHHRNLTARINNLSVSLNKVAYSKDVNDLASARILSMPEIWDCLQEGKVSPSGVTVCGDEIRGVMSHHSHEGLVRIEFSLAHDDKWIEVLSAQIEVK
ncbi:hypothetical protein [Pseudomonas sp. B10(2017)]|uniref:hypothetical protein n=1 Tax=Pseudomonas sp. B10(2017) TaxID=1981749 RepID=UPI000A1F8C8D|nr:hypothetical protein [Pseudomonas sp. B10(2017)]